MNREVQIYVQIRISYKVHICAFKRLLELRWHTLRHTLRRGRAEPRLPNALLIRNDAFT